MRDIAYREAVVDAATRLVVGIAVHDVLVVLAHNEVGVAVVGNTKGVDDKSA